MPATLLEDRLPEWPSNSPAETVPWRMVPDHANVHGDDEPIGIRGNYMDPRFSDKPKWLKMVELR